MSKRYTVENKNHPGLGWAVLVLDAQTGRHVTDTDGRPHIWESELWAEGWIREQENPAPEPEKPKRGGGRHEPWLLNDNLPMKATLRPAPRIIGVNPDGPAV